MNHTTIITPAHRARGRAAAAKIKRKAKNGREIKGYSTNTVIGIDDDTECPYCLRAMTMKELLKHCKECWADCP
jgi:hypothetical protein